MHSHQELRHIDHDLRPPRARHTLPPSGTPSAAPRYVKRPEPVSWVVGPAPHGVIQPFATIDHRIATSTNFGCFWLAGSQTHAGAHRHGPADLGRGDELHQGLYADHQGAKPSQEPTTGPQPARLRVQLPLPQPRRAARQARPAARRGGRKR